MTNPKKKWTSDEKKAVVDFAAIHGVTAAARKFNTNNASVKNWRDPEKYKARRKRYHSLPMVKEKNRKRAMQAYYENPDLLKATSKKSRGKRRFKRLVEMSNRFYPRDEWLTAIDLFHIAHKQKLICALTGVKLTNETISVDHIIPKSLGGSNRPDNIRLVDKNVNLARRALTDCEFLDLCRKVVEFRERNPAISDGVSDSPD